MKTVFNSYFTYEHETGWFTWCLKQPWQGVNSWYLRWWKPCHLYVPATDKSRRPALANAIPRKQSHTSTAGLEIVSLDKVEGGEKSSPQYYAQLWQPKANVDLIFALKHSDSFRNTHYASMTGPRSPPSAEWCVSLNSTMSSLASHTDFRPLFRLCARLPGLVPQMGGLNSRRVLSHSSGG